jgi:hypothetical protein
MLMSVALREHVRRAMIAKNTQKKIMKRKKLTGRGARRASPVSVKSRRAKPASRQYVMMGVGVLVLLLLIVGIGSALKAPSSNSTANRVHLAVKTSTFRGTVVLPIRLMLLSPRRAPPLQNKLRVLHSRRRAMAMERRIFPCRPSPLRLLKARHLQPQVPSSVLKCRVI